MMFRRFFSRKPTASKVAEATAAAPAEQLFKPVLFSELTELLAVAGLEVTEVSEGVLQTIVADVVLRMQLPNEHHWLLVKAEFPVLPPGVDLGGAESALDDEQTDKILHLLIDATNEWNSRWFMPTAYVDREADQWLIRLDCMFFIGSGLTASQLKRMVLNAAEYMQKAMRELPSLVAPSF
ncbi:MAG: YbjN domain-containing protein [Actinomycetaceae bacterium]|nr:YbjN domain-containing protein [Actinomycetaceae bacterium]